ncbi:SDR family oxidoreductase [Pseudonocardiaceae bacterium YIM PH 21723]|nr:SDR family oxidoreductase [Pseudonocardiaceae bacterium YIM PH 21723]
MVLSPSRAGSPLWILDPVRVEQWKNKAVLITGASRGIGKELARQLADGGARIGLVGLEPDLLAELAAQLGEGHCWVHADVTDHEGMAAATAKVVAEFGGLDVVVANAGVVPFGTTRQITPEAFTRTIDVNLNGVFHTVRCAIPHLIERRGYILVVSSSASLIPVVGMSAYCAAKSGAEALANVLRMELAHLGVRVGSAHTGFVDTDMTRQMNTVMPSLHRARTRLPWPLGGTVSAQSCARALVRGIERRARRIFVPRPIWLLHLGRVLAASELVQTIGARFLSRLVPATESEVRAATEH